MTEEVAQPKAVYRHDEKDYDVSKLTPEAQQAFMMLAQLQQGELRKAEKLSKAPNAKIYINMAAVAFQLDDDKDYLNNVKQIVKKGIDLKDNTNSA